MSAKKVVAAVPPVAFSGARLRELRLEAGLSLRDLGRMTGVPYQYLSLLDSGVRTQPGVTIVYRLADALGVGADAFRA